MIQSLNNELIMPLYKLTSPSGKSYIGVTRGDLRVRLNHHRFQCENNEGHLLHKAMRKHGFDNFKVDVLSYETRPKKLSELEIAAIAEHNTFAPNGYNLTRGGDGVVGTALSPDRIAALITGRVKARERKTADELAVEKARRAEGGRRAAERKAANPNYNHAEKIAEARRNRTPEQVAAEKINRSEAAKKRWSKPGHREKVSESFAKTRATAEFAVKRSIASKAGWSLEARARRADRTPEQVAVEKANRSAASKLMWEKRREAKRQAER